MSIPVRQPSTLAESNLLLALALLEKDCDCWQVIDRNEGRTGTIRKAPDVSCSKCAGKGKVPLLDPAGGPVDRGEDTVGGMMGLCR